MKAPHLVVTVSTLTVMAVLTGCAGGAGKQQKSAAARLDTCPATGKVSGVSSPLNVGWTEVLPVTYDIQKPWDQDLSQHHRYDPATDTHFLWVNKGDKPHAPPPNHTGPRAELRFRNDYLTGEHMFESDVYIVGGSANPCVMQIWGSGLSATTMMIHVRADGALVCGRGHVLKTNAFDTWLHLRVTHNPAGKGEVKIYIDDELRATLPGRGFRKDGGGFYFKCGVYGISSPHAEAWFRHIRLGEKPVAALP